MTTMGALLAPASMADLTSAVAERRRLFVRSEDPRRFRDLLPWATLNTLFSVNRFAPRQVRVLRESTDAQPSLYRDPADWSRVRVDALQVLAAQGVSVVINDIDRLVPAVAAVSAMVERHLRSAASVNAYLTFRQAGAFRPHWDGHDVLVLQLHGQKRWRTYGMDRDRPVEGHEYARDHAAGPVQWEQVLQPGDVLYLPRGEVHAASVEPGSTSVHLTVGLRASRGADVLRWLATRDEEMLRADVPACDAERLADHEAALKAAMHRLVETLDLKEVLAAIDREREARPAANFGALVAIDAGTWLASALPRRVPIPPPRDGTVTIKVGAATHQFSSDAAALLALLQDRDAMTIETAHAELRGLDLDAVRRAASDLARKGLIYAGLDS